MTCGPETRSARPAARARLCTWREASRILAGFNDGQATEGPTAGSASLVGLKIAEEHGWTAPPPPGPEPGPPPGKESR